jgi:hypothetical protein
MRDGEFARPQLAGMAVDFDLGDDRHHRTRALGVGDAAPARYVQRHQVRRAAQGGHDLVSNSRDHLGSFVVEFRDRSGAAQSMYSFTNFSHYKKVSFGISGCTGTEL